ncbi:MAG: carbohydrate binding domain-containing protein [Sedimentisphaerales bacterium]|nr:carbohydrate binding domain-containing protein [Sedimentisphaerales bacterium]
MCKKLIFLISFIVVLASASSLTQAANEIWREAESADPMTSPMMTYDDDPCASGGEYIGVAAGNNSTTASPSPDGTAHFIFDVPETGTYKVFVRVKLATDTVDDDSSYARIDGATYSSGADWIKWNNNTAYVGTDWEWTAIFNNDDGDAQVEFTMDAGQYDLEIAYREDGMYFDAILITDDLATDPATLPNAVPGGPACVEENILVNGSFEDGFEAPWVFDNASPAYEVVEGEAQHGGKALKVTIDAPGSSEYIPALAQPGLIFETGKHYTFSVFLKGSYDGMQVYLKPQDRGGSWTGYGAEYKTLTTEWAEYSVTTPDFGTILENDHDVSIWLGMQAGDVYIDHARWYEGDYVAPCPPEGPPPAVVKATKPMPENNASDLTRFNMLSWTPGDYADSHNVYFGTDMQAVTDATVDEPMGVLVSQQQTDAFYDTAGDYGTTYYWRIDEVNEADMTIYKGNVWNFSTKAIGLIVPQSSITVTASSQKDENQGPEKTIDGSGLTGDKHDTTNTNMWLSDSTSDPNQAWIRYDFDDVYKMPRMLIWNHNQTGFSAGYAMKEVVIEYSADAGETWTALDVNELAKGTGSALDPQMVDLGGVANGLAINAVRITAISNWTSAFKNYGLSEVRFYYVPVRPTTPSPADAATGVVVTPTLTWAPGDGSVEHMVYFGTDEQAVTDGTAASVVVTNPSFAPSGLDLGGTYFWRVVEVNMASVPSEWSGDTWSFTTSTYTVVDDFEGYGSSINKWNGGSSSSGNGAAINLDTDIANDGSKSMIFMFDDTSTNGYSEVSANPGQLTSGSNWTSGGPQWLVFYVYGDLANITTEKLYVKLNDATYWYQQDLIEDSELVTPWWTQVQVPLLGNQVNLNNVNSLKIGFIRTESKTGTGKINVDDIRLYKNLPTPIEPVNPGDVNLVARYKLDNNVNDSSGNGINGTIIGNPTFVANEYTGYNKALAFDANEDVVDLGPATQFDFTGSFSIAFWANIEDWGSEWGSVMVAKRGEGSEGFQIRRAGGYVAGMQGKTGEGLAFTTRGISLEGQSSNWSQDMIVDPPAIGRWTHIACIFDKDAGVKRVYFDSKLIQESATVGDRLSPASQNASLGARANSDNTGFEGLFNGSLDEVRLYDRVLSDAEVRYLSDPTP